MRNILASLVLIGAMLGGCAIKPIPDNVTGRSTSVIVQQVRCEAQRAIISLLADRMRQKGDPESLRLASLVEASVSNIVLFKNYAKLDPSERYVFSNFDDTIIVLDFQFRITENNDLGGGATLVNVFATGLDTVGLKVANAKERQNFRTFRVTTSIREIFKDICENATGRGPNYEYPIAGEIGLKETFQQYFEIALVNNLGSLQGWDGVSPFVDTIKFTTTVSGGIDPSHTVETIGRGYTFRNIGGSIGAKRADEHQLIVGLSLPKGTKAFAGPQNAAYTSGSVNFAVDNAITKGRIFGLSQIDPFGPLNAPR